MYFMHKSSFKSFIYIILCQTLKGTTKQLKSARASKRKCQTKLYKLNKNGRDIVLYDVIIFVILVMKSDQGI